MCLDYGPFKLISDDKETSLENVASLLVQPTGIKLIDNFGKTELVAGQITEIDLLNQRIILT